MNLLFQKNLEKLTVVHNSFNNFILKSLKKIPVLFFTPKPLATITYIRVFIFSFFLYKLLSRDYRIFSFASFRVLGIDPSEVYNSYLDYAALSNHILTDILTFHWIHWFVPFPSFQTLSFIYFSTIVFCIVVIIFGRGPKNLYCIISFIFLTYLWGYNWRSGNDVDAIFIQLQAALFFIFFKGYDGPIWTLKSFSLKPDKQAGYLYSMMILIFIGYYQLSGFNKLIDITWLDWFRYDLYKSLEDQFLISEAGSHIKINPIPWEIIKYLPSFVIDLSVPIVYFSHLCTFLMFFRRDLIAKFMYFYWTFHFVSAGLGIWFSGLLIFWCVFLPIPRMFEKITIHINFKNPSQIKFIKIIKKLNWLNRIEFKNSKKIYIFSISEKKKFYENNMITRIFWVIPVFWPLLPIIYFPLISLSIWKILKYF